LTAFSPEWLRQREPLDAASRDATLVAWLPPTSGTRHVVDLGAGTGANLRALAPRLGGAQEWLLVDDDAGLLEAAGAACSDWAETIGATLARDAADLLISGAGFRCRVRRRKLDLAAELSSLRLPEHCLVTCSALLDLVSAPWLATLTASCRSARAAALFALTYDGRATLAPEEPQDFRILELVNAHQKTDKGFGAALGPAAAGHCARLLSELGYEVLSRPSDWRISSAQRVLQTQLLDGWLEAALETAPPSEHDSLEHWRDRRREHVERGRSEMVVGHLDLAARLQNGVGY
jgi:hypothetical protein